jgi:hypothetical protein
MGRGKHLTGKITGDAEILSLGFSPVTDGKGLSA